MPHLLAATLHCVPTSLNEIGHIRELAPSATDLEADISISHPPRTDTDRMERSGRINSLKRRLTEPAEECADGSHA